MPELAEWKHKRVYIFTVCIYIYQTEINNK